jgi:molybdenum cofactor synthesis domain-containing protein
VNAVAVNVEVICIGNELLIGKIENTNATWLAKQISRLGVYLTRVTVIRDILEEIADTVNEVLARKPQFIITTGGLGPTFDDMTLQGVAKALNRKLEVNLEALEFVKQRCTEYSKKRGYPTEIELTLPRVKMATLPERTEVVNNPIGTAPSVRVDVYGTVLFVLPGVPPEMEAIFVESIAPLLKEAALGRVFCERSVFTENIFESKLAPLIDRVMSDNSGVYVKSHPFNKTKPQVELHLTINAAQECNPAEKLRKAAEQLADLIAKIGGTIKAIC